MNEPEEPNYTAYWAAALARHRALLAAGCVPMVGVRRVEKQDDGEQIEQEQDDAV